MKQKSPPEWMTPEQQELWSKAFSRPAKKKSTSPTNALTNAVREYCELLGCTTARINVTGIFDEQRGLWRKSGSTNGVEDIDVTLPVKINGRKMGVKIAVEIKYGKDRQSDDQVKRQQRLEQAGAHYVIAKTFDQFKNDFDKIVYSYAET